MSIYGFYCLFMEDLVGDLNATTIVGEKSRQSKTNMRHFVIKGQCNYVMSFIFQCILLL